MRTNYKRRKIRWILMKKQKLINSEELTSILSGHLKSSNQLLLTMEVTDFDTEFLKELVHDSYELFIEGNGKKQVFEDLVKKRLTLDLMDQEVVNDFRYNVLLDALTNYELSNNVQLNLENNEVLNEGYSLLVNNYGLVLDFTGLNKLSSLVGLNV